MTQRITRSVIEARVAACPHRTITRKGYPTASVQAETVRYEPRVHWVECLKEGHINGETRCACAGDVTTKATAEKRCGYVKDARSR